MLIDKRPESGLDPIYDVSRRTRRLVLFVLTTSVPRRLETVNRICRSVADGLHANRLELVLFILKSQRKLSESIRYLGGRESVSSYVVIRYKMAMNHLGANFANRDNPIAELRQKVVAPHLLSEIGEK